MTLFCKTGTLLLKDFRTPLIEDEGDLEDRQDWSDADVQKLDALGQFRSSLPFRCHSSFL